MLTLIASYLGKNWLFLMHAAECRDSLTVLFQGSVVCSMSSISPTAPVSVATGAWARRERYFKCLRNGAAQFRKAQDKVDVFHHKESDERAIPKFIVSCSAN